MPLQPGDLLHGRYRVTRTEGAGGMARVHRVEDEARGVSLVLKELRADTPELRRALENEFAVLVRVSSQFLTRVHDYGTDRVRGDTIHFYTAEWVDGVTIGELARRTPPKQWLTALMDALEGLDALHALSIRHGDFTPDNVLVRGDGGGVLIDLGCAAPFGSVGATISGSEGFLPRELLSGGRGDGRSDLFAVGVTLERLRRLSGAAAPELAELARRLCDPDPDRRPSSVHDVLTSLGQKRAERRGRILLPGFFGREPEIARFRQWLDDASGAPVLCVDGPAGAGTTRLVREMLAAVEHRPRVVHARFDDRAPVDLLIEAVTGGTGGQASRVLPGAVATVAASREPMLLVMEDADRLDGVQAERLGALARSLPEGGAVRLLLSGGVDLGTCAVDRVSVGPLTVSALREWTRGALSERGLADLARNTGGMPARVELALAAPGAKGRPRLLDTSARHEWFRGELSARSAAEVEAIALLAVSSGTLDPVVLGMGASELQWVDRCDWVHRDGPRVRLSLREDEQPLLAALSPTARSRAHLRVARALSGRDTDGASAVTRAEILRHLALGGAVRDAESELLRHACRFRTESRAVMPRVSVLLSCSRAPDVLLRIAELALEAQATPLALHAAARALAVASGRAATQARLLFADALIRQGKSRRAEAVVARVLRDRDGETRARGLVRASRARMLRGDPEGALQAARDGLSRATSWETELALRELSAAAASYLGRTAEAETAFTELLLALPDSTPARDRCRLLGQRAIAAFRLGKPVAAREDHARALEIAESSGQDDLVAVSALNLGTAEQQTGQLGRALASYERGLAVARAIGRVSTELTLRYNLANVRAEIGEFTAARSELEVLERLAEAQGLLQFVPAVALLHAEIALAEGDHEEAARRLDVVDRVAAPGSRERVEHELLRAELALAASNAEAARGLSTHAGARAEELGADDLVLRSELVLAKIARALGDASALKRLSRALLSAHEKGHKVLEAQLATEQVAAAERFTPAESPKLAGVARKLWDRLAADLPEPLRERFYEDARRASLWRFTRAVRAAPGSSDAEALRRLLSLTRRMNSSLSLSRVLDYTVEAAVELTGAERGFLLLGSPPGPMDVAASRDGGDSGQPPSSSIVRRAIESEEAVLTTDAQADPRFQAGGSVHALRLKSVLCVPIATPGGPIGALYVDSRVQRGRFSEAHRDLLSSLADQAALSVSNARLHADLAAKADELARQKATIERLSRGKDREIEQLKEQVESRQRALELRYDYGQIIGRGPAMQAALHEVDRVVDATVNVVIHGESGTGKELVARALHWNGPRKAGPFVGINCAALPEPLLESELFGHVRGAFSGAERDKSGLMVEANGGTLFLDEIGEVPVAIQAKLLRAVQEREVRPLGTSRAVPLDIRLVCATHRDLAEEVRAGRFREDLYYRIAVVTIRLPPLRDRVEDLPDLVNGILGRLAKERGKPPPSVDRSAWRALAAHSWPGNVRELENTLTRAFVLGDHPQITAADLEFSEAKVRSPRARTRQAFEEGERERILNALQSARWNVSVVSRALGIPRNSLYRKLARYGLARDAERP